MTFTKEDDFENALIEILPHKGWEKDVIKCPTEKWGTRKNGGRSPINLSE